MTRSIKEKVLPEPGEPKTRTPRPISGIQVVGMVLCKIACSRDAHLSPKNLYEYLGVPHQAALGVHLWLAVASICSKARLVA